MVSPLCRTRRPATILDWPVASCQPVRMMKKTRWMALATIALVAAACGDGDGGRSASNDPKVLEVQAVLQDDQDFPMSDEEANCAAQEIVENVDPGTLDQMLADPEADLGEVADSETAVKVLEGIFDCADVEQLMIDSMVEDGTPQDVAECMASELGEDKLKDFMISASAGDDAIGEDAAGELLAELLGIAAECGFTG